MNETVLPVLVISWPSFDGVELVIRGSYLDLELQQIAEYRTSAVEAAQQQADNEKQKNNVKRDRKAVGVASYVIQT